MSKVVIVSYDLDKVKEGDNNNVKEALLKHTNVFTTLSGIDKLSSVPLWVTLSLPDTTVLVSVNESTSCRQVVEEVAIVIRKAGSKVGKIYAAPINTTDEFLYNEK